MSWWPLPKSVDDLTGDGPADAVDKELLGLARRRDAASEPKPSLAELLRAVEISLAENIDLIENAAAGAHTVNRDGLRPAEAAPQDLVDAVGRAVAGIAAAFQADQLRRPRVAEVLYTFTFTLRGEPQTILRPPIPDEIGLRLA